MQEGEEFYSAIEMAKADNVHDEGLGAARGRTKGDDGEWHHSKIGEGEGVPSLRPTGRIDFKSNTNKTCP